MIHNQKSENVAARMTMLKKMQKSARRHAEAGRWSQRAIGLHLGRHPTHVNLVLCGNRPSFSLLKKILELPPRANVPKNSKYRKAS